MNENTKHIKVLLLVAGLMLCLAVLPVWPYGYYTLLRLVVCGVAGYSAYYLKSNAILENHLVPLVLIAVLFNPIIPVYLSRGLWWPIDLGAALYFLTLSKKLPS